LGNLICSDDRRCPISPDPDPMDEMSWSHRDNFLFTNLTFYATQLYPARKSCMDKRHKL
ncbi:unnamed protein product, partial [Allacma fusca]